jgi:diadenosine tetraphosphate (Ap4A) HIT family hydrolase
MACELCDTPGGELIWQDGLCRVVRLEDPDYPGFCRVILNSHIREMSDLAPHDRAALINVVFAVEQAVRDILQPDKINLASLGNKTPHLHWHVIPRFGNDRTFPNPIWGEPTHETLPKRLGKSLAIQLATAINNAVKSATKLAAAPRFSHSEDEIR